MRTQSVTVGSATASSWMPLDTRKNPTSVSLAGTITSGAGLTYKVQHTFDPVQNVQPCSITRVTTTATLTLTDHGITGTTDSITVVGAGAPFDGTYAVASVTNANVITYTVADSGATSTGGGAGVVVMRVFDHDTMTGKTTSDDSNYAFPPTAVRLNVTAYTSGKATLTVTAGG